VQLAKELKVIGLMNIQFAVVGTRVMTRRFILKPTACFSDCAFVSKATGVPLAKLASLIMAGKTLSLDSPKNRHLLILRSRKWCCFINSRYGHNFGARCALLVK